jgi:glycosyltransferase involved in cell wall biosynthesis
MESIQLTNMKILYLNTLYAPHIGGGAEVILREQVEAMRNRGHEVIVLTTDQKPGLSEDQVNGVRVLRAGLVNVYWHHCAEKAQRWQRAVWHLRDIYNPAMGRVVEEVVHRERPDVVCCHNLAGWSSAAWGAIKQVGVPVIQVLHDLYNLCPNSNMFRDRRACPRRCGRCKAFRLPHRRLSEDVDAVVGVSRFVLERHLKYGLFGKARIRRSIHNARNLRAPVRFGPAGTDGKVRFGFIGTLAPSKGIELLLKTFSGLELSNAELRIAGNGKQEYEQALRHYNSENIRFLGHVKVEDFFPSIDVLAVPSLWHDTLPSVVFESLAYGVPVIGSRRGGIPEMVQEGFNGFLFDPERTKELASVLARCAADPSAIEAMRPKTAKSAAPYLDIGRWVSKYETLYHEVVTACAR